MSAPTYSPSDTAPWSSELVQAVTLSVTRTELVVFDLDFMLGMEKLEDMPH